MFDIDKVTILLKSLTPRYDRDAALKDFKKSSGFLELNLELESEAFESWYERNQERYLRGFDVIRYKHPKDDKGNIIFKNDINQIFQDALRKDEHGRYINSKQALESEIIDLMFASLTCKSKTEQFLNVGSFEKQKRVSRIMKLLPMLTREEFSGKTEIKTLSGKTYTLNGAKSLYGMTIKTLEDIISTKQTVADNILMPLMWVKLHQRNMAGKNLISVSAVHAANHNMIQDAKITIGEKYQDAFTFSINGKLYVFNSLTDIKNLLGEVVSRNVSGNVTAVVDNGKDPVAEDLNFNEITANLYLTLLRTGIPTYEATLLINQPIFKKACLEASYNHLKLGDALKKVLKSAKDYVGALGISAYDKKEVFEMEALAMNIVMQKDLRDDNERLSFYTSQYFLGEKIAKLLEVSDIVSDITSQTRFDTPQSGAGKNIPSVQNKLAKRNKLVDKLEFTTTDDPISIEGDLFKRHYTVEEALSSAAPLNNLLFTLGVDSVSDLTREYFPYFDDDHVLMFNYLNELSYRTPSDMTIQNMYDEYISFAVVEALENALPNVPNVRDYFINQFPSELANFLKTHASVRNMSLFKHLLITEKNEYHTAGLIKFRNGGKVVNVDKMTYAQELQYLYDKGGEFRDMATKLFFYYTFRGFGFGVDKITNFMPTAIKTNPLYINILRGNFEGLHFSPLAFVLQYVRNHLNNYELFFDTKNLEGFKHTVVGDIKDGMVEVDLESFPDFVNSEGKIVSLYKFGNDFYLITGIPNENPQYKKLTPPDKQFKYIDYNPSTDDPWFESVLSTQVKERTEDSSMEEDDTEEMAMHAYYSELADAELSYTDAKPKSAKPKTMELIQPSTKDLENNTKCN